jgi:hypothetical protein
MNKETQSETNEIDDLEQLKHLLRLIEAEDEDPGMLMITACICRLSAVDKREYRRQIFDQEEEKEEEALELVYRKIENEMVVYLYNKGYREGEIAKIINDDTLAVVRRVEAAKIEGRISE